MSKRFLMLIALLQPIAWNSTSVVAQQVSFQAELAKSENSRAADGAIGAAGNSNGVNRQSTISIQASDKTEIRLRANAPVPAGDFSLKFEAFCLGSTSSVKLLATRSNGEAVSVSLPKVQHSEAFVTYSADIFTDLQQVEDVRLQIHLQAKSTLQIKSVRLEPRSTISRSSNPITAAATIDLKAYLDASFPGKITHIHAAADTLFIEGTLPPGSGPISIAEVSMSTLLKSDTPFRSVFPIVVKPDGTFSTAISRTGSDGRDLAISKWQLIKMSNGTASPFSHCRYVDRMHCFRPQLPAAKVTSKKGLGGWRVSSSEATRNDLQDLGVKAVTINVNAMHDLVSMKARAGWAAFQWQGKTYYSNPRRLKSLDATLLAAQEQQQMVSVILLVTNPKQGGSETAKLLANPEADDAGIFAMPNVTSEAGLNFYGAILKLMAERWTRPDARYGRIHHWIIHNEVDFGWVWTNAGRKSDVQFMSLYHRSMRLTDLIVRQYDPNAKVWISLTHHWASTGTSDGYGSKRILELLLKYCSAEGDFPWAVAYHPYPQNLRDPRTWKDGQATQSFNSDKITPKNLEVLDAWMKRPEMTFQGSVRPVHLSENGFNSKDYSAKALEDQAAGMALAWQKMKGLSSIKMWHYHNWIDNRHEGGLRIGLRKFPDDSQEPYGKKPIWHLYQALGTSAEDKVSKPYLKTIGISSWAELMSSEPIQ